MAQWGYLNLINLPRAPSAFYAIAESNGFSIAGGGDTAAVDKYEIAEQVLTYQPVAAHFGIC